MKEKQKNIYTFIASIIISIATIYVLLITSFEIAAYGNFDYFEKEYKKYGVTEALNMEMEDVMYVTREMMSFLRGDRETLVVETVVGGEERTFFNEREILHMEDVRDLFIGGILGRRICFVVAALLFVGLLVSKAKWKIILAQAFQYTTAGFISFGVLLGVLFATDFNKYFTIFHHIFFEGDTWLFDPNTSLMINMLPEGFFYDITARIVVIFVVFMASLLVGTVQLKRKEKK